MKNFICFLFLLPLALAAQKPDHIYYPNIRTVKLYRAGDMYSYPVLQLGAGEQLELHFDDTDNDVKYYYYSFQLCNADWTPANVQPYDYIRGFQTNRISTYRGSSIVQSRYTHYQALLPERNGGPTKGGNYLLKVFLNDDTSRLAFTKRLLVVNKKASVAGQVLQPFNGNLFQTHQRIQAGISVAGNQINPFSPQDIKLVMLQNYNWRTASMANRPTLFRGNYYEYSDEEVTLFPAGKEWRWADLRSFRLRSDRVLKITDSDTSDRVDIYLNPDIDRRKQIYMYFRDINGLFICENNDNPNPFWQADYGWVHFTYVPSGNQQLPGRQVYVFGELTQYETDEQYKMTFNPEKGVYEAVLYLKQGYYNYSYVSLPENPQRGTVPVPENAEGNFWGTENVYMLLVYFRPFGARSDELIGYTLVNSAIQR